MNYNLKKAMCLLAESLTILLLATCDRNLESCCTIISTDVQIQYVNQAGENLINSSAAFNAYNIKIYYKNGENFEYIYNANLDAPNMYSLVEDSVGDTIMKVFTSNYYDENQSTTLIELNENVVDTLVCEYTLTDNSEIIDRAWLNGVEMDERFLKVAK